MQVTKAVRLPAPVAVMALAGGGLSVGLGGPVLAASTGTSTSSPAYMALRRPRRLAQAEEPAMGGPTSTTPMGAGSYTRAAERPALATRLSPRNIASFRLLVQVKSGCLVVAGSAPAMSCS